MAEQYKQVGEIDMPIIRLLSDTDPNQLVIAADALEEHGFSELAEIFRESRIDERELVIEGWMRIYPGNVLHYAEEGATESLCGKGFEEWQRRNSPSTRKLYRQCQKCERKLQQRLKPGPSWLQEPSK